MPSLVSAGGKNSTASSEYHYPSWYFVVDRFLSNREGTLRLRSAMVRERTHRLLRRTNPFAPAVKRVILLAELF